MIDLWTAILALIVVGAIAIHYKLRDSWTFFSDRGIPHLNQYPFFSSFWTMFVKKKNFAEVIREQYLSQPDAKYVGVYDFDTPMIMIRDLDLIKSITMHNIDHFQNRRAIQFDEIEPLFGKNLFSLRGDRWKEMRTLLSPAFTSSKLKAMFKLMRECANKYGDHFAAIPQEGKSIELKDAFTRYTNDVIATCVFGVDVDSMADRNNEFYVYGNKAAGFDGWLILKIFLLRSAPLVFKLTGMRIFDVNINKFFMELIENTIKTRDEQGIVRPDLIQLMMEARGKTGKELSIVDMAAQAFTFFFGGFESTSSLMCFAAYEIGVNPEIQKRLQDEIDEVLEKCNGEVTYEAINDMKFLDAVVNEALRMYPAAGASDRCCTKPFELPPAKPGLKPYVVQKDEHIWIPIYGVQHDPRYFEEPTKFKPERFMDDPKKIMNSGMFLSFGLGPRMCIGNRFALLETKILLFNVFARCNLKPNAKTTIPMVLSVSNFQITAKYGFWFDIEPRKVAIPVLGSSVSNSSAND